MRLFFAVLLYMYIIPKVKSVPKKECITKCRQNKEIFCVEISHAGAPTIYTPMFECAVQEFKCNLENDAKLTYVEMSKCQSGRPVENLNRRANSVEEEDHGGSNEQACPTSCSMRRGMVCARVADGPYRSFFSDCYLRMYQCKHPTEKLELVSRHSCYAFGPVLADLPRPDGSNEVPYGDQVLDYIDERMVKEDSHEELSGGGMSPMPMKQSYRTPKPTVPFKWTRSIRRTPRLTSSTRVSSKTKPTEAYKTETSTTTRPPTTTEDLLTIAEDSCDDEEDETKPIKMPGVCNGTRGVLNTGKLFMKVDLSPDAVEDTAPIWLVSDKGATIYSHMRADMGFMLHCEVYAGLDYTGNVIVNSFNDDDFIGLVFGYQSNRQFYLLTWKSIPGTYWRGEPFIVRSFAGIHIKRVKSATGPGIRLRNSIYKSDSQPRQVTLLWRDPTKIGWKPKRPYKWHLIHRPHIGLIRVKIYNGTELLVDSGNVFDSSYHGGRIGVFCFSQENVKWWNMKSECNDKIPSNLMSELPADLQNKSVVDKDYIF